MEKLMIDKSIDELFNSIENSNVYKRYKEIENILSKDTELLNLINEIKELEKKATKLEHIGNTEYKDIDKIIKDKLNILNNKPIYIEYLNRMNELNDELAASSKMIEDYLKEKV